MTTKFVTTCAGIVGHTINATKQDALACTEFAAQEAHEAGLSRATWLAMCERAWETIREERDDG